MASNWGFIITKIFQIKSFPSVVNNKALNIWGVNYKQGSCVAQEVGDIKIKKKIERKIRGEKMKFSHAHIFKL